MDFTKEQLSEAFVKHLDREKGLQDLMELMIESMMMAERREFLSDSEGNKGTVFAVAAVTARVEYSSSGYLATGTATFILPSWHFFAIRKKSVSCWQAACTVRDLHSLR